MTARHFLNASAPLAVSDRDKDVVPRLKDIPDLQQFIWNHSELRSLRLCSKFMSCDKCICPWCSTRRSRVLRRSLAPVAHAHNRVLVLRLSVVSSPSLDSAWDELEKVKKYFLANRYLAKRADGWFTQKELTHTRWGWNVHLNFLIFDDDDSRLDTLRSEAISRWLKAASATGVPVAPTAQYAELWKNPRKAVAYSVKGIIHQKWGRTPSDGYSAGDLLALFHQGDADAAEAWGELEKFFSPGSKRRRWTDKGGSLRCRKTVAA